MLVASFEPPSPTSPPRSPRSPRPNKQAVDYQFLPAAPAAPTRDVIVRQPTQPQFDFALEGRSICLQRREQHLQQQHLQQQQQQHGQQQQQARVKAGSQLNKTFSPLQLRIDLHSEQGVDLSAREPDKTPGSVLSRRQRAQLRRRQEQQKPAEEVVYQRRTRPKTPAACPRTPLAMSTMSMPAAGQKFVTDDDSVFNSAEEASAAVKRLLAKTSLSEEHHVSTRKVSETCSSTFISDTDYLQDSFDFLHQRHVKNLSDVISRHQQRQQLQPAASQEQSTQSTQSSKHKKQVHIHQSSFYDGQNGEMNGDSKTFKSTRSINLSNNNSSSSCDLEDAKQQQLQQQQQQRRYERENSTSSVQSSTSSLRSGSSDNCNNNFCDTVSVNNKSNTKMSSKSSTSSTSSSTTRVQQSFKKQVVKQSFSSSSQDFEDRMGIDVMLTPSPGALALSTSPMELAAATSSTSGTSKVTSKVSSSSSVCSASSDRPDECKQSVKTFKSKTVKKTVSDGKQVKTDVDKCSETAEEAAEGSPDKPVITFSHVSSEGSHQTFTDSIVRFDSSALSSPSRSRSPSPLLEMPAPYNDLSKEIKRPPMETA